MERATVAQVIHWGLEAVAGATPAAAAFRRLQSLSVALGVQDEHQEFRPQGQKFATVTAQNREWTAGELEGAWTYQECIYPLASLLGQPVSAQVMDGAVPTGVYEHVFSPAVSAEDTPQTFTWEQGSAATRVHRVNYGLVTSVNMGITREALELGGSVLAGRLDDGVAFTAANPTAVSPLVPMMPREFSVYLDETSGGLGGTKLTRVLAANWSVGEKWNPAWFVDAAQESWGAHVEVPPDTGAALTVEANSEGMALLERLRDGDTRFLRIEATGPEVYSGGITAGYLFRLDMAVQVNGTEDFSDEDGIFAMGYGLRTVADEGWGRALRVTVRNTRAAL